MLSIYHLSSQFGSVQSCAIFCDPTDCSTPGFPVPHQLPELAQTHVYWVGDAIQPSHLLLSPFPPVFNLSQHQGLFKWIRSSHAGGQRTEVSAWTSVVILMNIHEYPGLISFRMDWLDLLAVQGTLKNLLQHCNSKASILLCSCCLYLKNSWPQIAEWIDK